MARARASLVRYSASSDRGRVAVRLGPLGRGPWHGNRTRSFRSIRTRGNAVQGIRPHRGARGRRGSRTGLTGDIAMPNPLQQLTQLGQSIWYDFITRDLIHSGELARLIREDSLRGMTP